MAQIGYLSGVKSIGDMRIEVQIRVEYPHIDHRGIDGGIKAVDQFLSEPKNLNRLIHHARLQLSSIIKKLKAEKNNC